MITDTAAKRDTQKLQRAIVDGLEDVKAQDIQVFDTEHLSALFERVIIASGTSNRQTKALAASVRDAVREAGFPKPRIEGESNGEWIIVDCAQAVVHIMQPSFRTYYHLEELWGDKPVRLKFGAVKPAVKAPAPVKAAPVKKAAAVKKGGVKAPVKPVKRVKTTRPLAPPAPVSVSVAKKLAKPAARSAAPAAAKRSAAAPVAAKRGAAPAATKRGAAPAAATRTAAPVAAKKAPARKAAAAPAPAPASRAAAVKAPVKTAARKTPASKA